MDDKQAREASRFLSFPHLPDDAKRDGKPVLNKYSTTLTREHDFPGAQVLDLRLHCIIKLMGSRLCSMLLGYQTSRL